MPQLISRMEPREQKQWIMNVNVIFIILIIWMNCICNSYPSSSTIYDISMNKILETVSPIPCKLYNTSNLDCSRRDFSDISSMMTSLSARVTMVTSIDFNEHNLTTIPAFSFANHPKLLHLDFTFGNIRNLDRDAFIGIQNLTTLLFNENKLRSLSDGVFRDLENLKLLDLTANLLTTFSSAVLHPLISLVELNLVWNQISDFNPDASLARLTKLEKLAMSSQFTTDYTTSGNTFFQSSIFRNSTFQNLPYLTEINWLFNPIIAVDSEVFTSLKALTTLLIDCSGFRTIDSIHSNLTTLSIRCIDYDSLFIDKVAPNNVLSNRSFSSLAKLNRLSSLDLGFGIQSITDGAFVWFSSLRTLDLNGNNLREISANGFDGLEFLEELDLTFNSLETLPSDAFHVFRHLKVLNLADNGLSVIPHDHPMPFGPSSGLERLILANNEIRGETLPDYAFNALSSLRVLDVSHNKLEGVISWDEMSLMKLEELYLDGNSNELSDSLEWNTTMPSLKVISLKDMATKLSNFRSIYKMAPSLETLNCSGTSVFSLSFLDRFQNIKALDLSNNEIDSDASFYSIYDEEYGRWTSLTLSKLEVLNLSQNKLSYLVDGTFQRNPLIIELDLSENAIANIDALVFAPLSQLAKLDLSQNKLTSLSPLLNIASSIKFVSASGNNIVDVPSDFPSLVVTSGVEMLDLSGNPFDCSCKGTSAFQHWILTDTETILHPGTYVCSSPEERLGDVITDVPLDCKDDIFTYIISGVVALLVVSTLIFLTVKYRWHISYIFFLLFKRHRSYSPYIDDENITSLSPAHQFDVYVSYNEGNEDWVLKELQPHMELVQDSVRLFIGARDLPLGECILDATVDVITKCRRTLLVLSSGYMDDEWRYFEMLMAQQRLFEEGRDVLVLVLLEDIPDAKMTMLMRQMMCQKTYLKWPGDRFGRDLFWQHLKEELRKPTRADRINEV